MLCSFFVHLLKLLQCRISDHVGGLHTWKKCWHHVYFANCMHAEHTLDLLFVSLFLNSIPFPKTWKRPPRAEWILHLYNAEHSQKAHEMYQCQKTGQRSSFSLRKTANHRIFSKSYSQCTAVHRKLGHQRPVRVGLGCKARYDHP